MWQLPLPEDYRRNLDSEIADLRNISSGGGAGTLTAGLFLKEFTGDAPWAHLDIAGTARSSSDDAETTKGGTGYGVRTLVELAIDVPQPGQVRNPMPRPMKRSLVVVTLVACALLGVAACGGSSKPKAVPAPTDLRGKPTVDIDAKNNQWSPDDVIVTVGTKVTWHNTDAVTHNIKKSSDSVDFGAKFGTDSFAPGQTYSFTFTKAGTYPYACTIHAAMTGKIEVVAA